MHRRFVAGGRLSASVGQNIWSAPRLRCLHDLIRNSKLEGQAEPISLFDCSTTSCEETVMVCSFWAGLAPFPHIGLGPERKEHSADAHFLEGGLLRHLAYGEVEASGDIPTREYPAGVE